MLPNNKQNYMSNRDEIIETAKRNVEAYLRSTADRAIGEQTIHPIDSANPNTDCANMTRSEKVLANISSIPSLGNALMKTADTGRGEFQSHNNAPTAILSTEDRSGQITQVVKEFPHKLFLALQSTLYTGSISWTDCGSAWKIQNLEAFFTTILPILADGSTMSHFTSFVHFLNIWGFQQISAGKNVSAFYHVCFRRDHMELLDQMTPDLLVPANLSGSLPAASEVLSTPVVGEQAIAAGGSKTTTYISPSSILAAAAANGTATTEVDSPPHSLLTMMRGPSSSPPTESPGRTSDEKHHDHSSSK